MQLDHTTKVYKSSQARTCFASTCMSHPVATMARFFKSIAGLLLVASTARAKPVSSFHAGQNTATSPCAQVASSVAAQTAAAPTVSAQLAYDCLTSVPFNQSAALALVDGVVPYFRWQSNTVWLKDPPTEYAEKVQPGIDIWGQLSTIRAKVVANTYANEYEVCRHHVKLTPTVLLMHCIVWLRALSSSAIHTRRPFCLYPRRDWNSLHFCASCTPRFGIIGW